MRISGKFLLLMPHGYHQPYVAQSEQPYWHYRFGHSPIRSAPEGSIPEGAIVYLQGPGPSMGTHQSGFLPGVGRIIVKIGAFRPAPALVTNS